jgi:glycosyltransferase involved in cell wall biosynthesis
VPGGGAPLSAPLLSIVVPAYDEERWLGPTLAALHVAARSAGVPYEIVVADDASSDGTPRVAREAGARVVEVAHRQIAATRNAGARAARGDLLLFVDADTLVTPAVVAAAVAALRAGAAGGGAGLTFDEPVPPYARLLTPILVRLFRAAGLATGCFLFCTRQAFEAAGGFDARLYAGEEIALSLALRRQGPFVVLRERVATSGRKLRSYSAFTILGTATAIVLRGPRALRRRQGLGLWYEDRRVGS